MSHDQDQDRSLAPELNGERTAALAGSARGDDRHRASVTIAHDYLTQSGGAERVALELARIFKPEEFVTSVYTPNTTFQGFDDFRIRQSFLRRLRALHSDVRRALPLLPVAWSTLAPIETQLVICSSSGWSHGVRTRSGGAKIVYCHNPARWLYQREDYVLDQSRLVRVALSVLRPFLLFWDRRSARSADLYIANSSSVAARVKEAYGITPQVIHPPVAIDPSGERQAVAVEPGYFLSVGRARGYKGADLLVSAFRNLPSHRLVLVGARSDTDLPANVEAVGRVSEAELRWLYANARALVSVSHEDFGLTPIEANSLGTPALLLRSGGFLDSTAEGVSGSFIDQPTVESIVDAVESFPETWDHEEIKRHAEKFSPESFAEQIKAAVASVAR
ncbi:glycosyltransferase [Microbacterium schleiferi]|uniref:glycosyltransferase n=1 Tax=Microbacterium schleiferi TaxID=69362 RepID=UPI001D170808|nr:glycosyltransferase [Microbacterium schleiferi]MCC4266750.1 glycosyltransferase [Microbacterium schleiferi]